MTSGSMWGVVIPLGGRNLLTNPSGELGTTGWESVNSANIGSFSDRQAFGAWSVRLSSTGLGTQGVRMGTYTAAAGGTYTLSVHILGRPGSVYVLGPQNIATGGFAGGSVVATSNGSWQRLSVMYGEASSINRGLLVAARDTGHTGAWWADGAQVEAGTYVTTYIDGDQDGCLWEGAPHASPSVRLPDQRAGGTMVPLAAIGLRPETTPGAGMPPTLNQLQPYAIADGGAYQRTRYESRTLTITATMTGTSYGDLATTRRRVIDALKAGRAPTPAPARLVYWGAGGTVTLDALYSEGLDGAYDNVVSEIVAARFVAPDPAWTGLFDEGTSLAPYTVLGSTNFIAYRDPAGRWGTMANANGTSVVTTNNFRTVMGITPINGTVYVAGDFQFPGGTGGHRYIAQFVNGAWGTLGPGSVSMVANELAWMSLMSPVGTLYVAGPRTANGTTTRGVAQWNPSAGWGTLVNTGPVGSNGPTRSGNEGVRTLAYTGDGLLAIGGRFDAVGGTRAEGICTWNGAEFGTLTGGTLAGGGLVRAIAAVNQTLYVGGDFTAAGGTAAAYIATYRNRAWGTLQSALDSVVQDIAPQSDLTFLVGGEFAGAFGTGLTRVSGLSFTPAGSLVTTATYGARSIAPTSDGGAWVAGTVLQPPGAPFGVGLVRWNGYSHALGDLFVFNGARPTAGQAVALSASGTLYYGGDFVGIGTAAAVADVVNRGMSDAYPVLRMRNTGAAVARVYQLLNTTTGDDIYFSLALIPGETATLDLRPESLSFTSNVKGAIISSILGGSNLSTWRLAPGTNTVSFFSDGPSVRTDLYWRPRHLSADGGAEATI